jgi:hypothetical protein
VFRQAVRLAQACGPTPFAGDDGNDAERAYKKLTKLAVGERARNPRLTEAQAFSKAFRDNPELAAKAVRVRMVWVAGWQSWRRFSSSSAQLVRRSCSGVIISMHCCARLVGVPRDSKKHRQCSWVSTTRRTRPVGGVAAKNNTDSKRKVYLLFDLRGSH